ncbi:MAG: SPFH domain-containing protein, partial [Adhaeribacter sp.]
FIDKIVYRHTLKEQAIDVPPQNCITRDNIAVEVDGILYLQVVDPAKSSYGIDNYRFAAIQIAQTTMRSVVGKLELDRTFEERETINASIVNAVDVASEPWGVKVTRYEVKNINPPATIRDAMEKQMRAEREKRAIIAESEGDKQARINRAEGEKSQMIAVSEGEKQRRINEAEGRAAEIERIASATAQGIREIAMAINAEGGMNAVNLRVAEQYLNEFGKLAKTNNTMIIPTDLADISGVVGSITSVMNRMKEEPAFAPSNGLPKSTRNTAG